MGYQKVGKERLSELVTRQLKESIFNGQYQPGERIPPEHQLVESFGVSRVIVREAIRDLERSGLIQVKRGPKGGAVVQPMRHDAVTSVVRDLLSLGRARVSDIMEVRLQIEPIVAGLAAERANEMDLDDLRNNLAGMPTEPGDDLVTWNVNFHRLVAQAAHNPMYSILVNILMDFTVDMILSLKPADRVVHDEHWHPAIFKKIEARDVEGATQLFHQHLLDVVPALTELERAEPGFLLH